MDEDRQKQWLFVNGVIRKLKQGRHWMSILDPWREHVDIAIEHLEQAKKQLEEE